MVKYEYCKKYSKQVYCENGKFFCPNLVSSLFSKEYKPICKATYEVCDLGIKMIEEDKTPSGLIKKIAIPAMSRPKGLAPRA